MRASFTSYTVGVAAVAGRMGAFASVVLREFVNCLVHNGESGS